MFEITDFCRISINLEFSQLFMCEFDAQGYLDDITESPWEGWHASSGMP